MPTLAEEPRILENFWQWLQLRGVVGERATAQLLYLALTSRILDRPCSIAIKGLSSTGKSHVLARTLEFFPRESYLEFTTLSEKALANMPEELAHRTLIFFEAHALREDSRHSQIAYVVRSLLSEGKLVHERSVPDGDGGWTTERIEKEGPTNLIFTTTATSVHPENETRCLSLATDDSPQQTQAILRQQARGADSQLGAEDLEEWRKLQEWLAEPVMEPDVEPQATTKFVLPFAEALAELVPPVAVRLRRDFPSVLSLISTHAVLHQVSRERDGKGRVVATLEDYDVVRELVAPLVAEGVEASTPDTVRETVKALRALGAVLPKVGTWTDTAATAKQVADKLGIEKSNATRRLHKAAEGGYVQNLEEKPLRPGRWVVGEPLPEQVDVLPATATLRRNWKRPATTGGSRGSCAVASDPEGDLRSAQRRDGEEYEEVVV